MTSRVLSRREAAIWLGAFLVVAALLVVTGFTSDDPDSALYANLSARLAAQPPAHWIAPEWWGYWDSDGLFREHPIGVFLLPTLLGAAGIPGVQAAYIVGIAAGLASLLLLGHLIARVTTPADGRLALVMLQLMPVAFIFRIRANHEYPMLLSLLVLLIGLDRVRVSWRWLPIPALALTAALLVKGVFVVIPLLAAVIWIAVNPLRVTGPAWRPLAACLLGIGAMTAVAAAYDALYLQATGETFWYGYWTRQLEPLTLASPVDANEQSALVRNMGFYLLRLLWHPAPWSVALLVAGWRARARIRAAVGAMSDRGRRGLLASVGFAVASIALLTPASRFAERYPFSAHYAIAAAGATIALYLWPRLRARLEEMDRAVPALPAVLWFLLMILRLTVGGMLPRISG
jgi:4-amino-4-deoxy-L-arabinose transferase-like glycosyltransferase